MDKMSKCLEAARECGLTKEDAVSCAGTGGHECADCPYLRIDAPDQPNPWGWLDNS